MIEKVTLRLTKEAGFRLEGVTKCNDLNPKALFLYAGAKCAGLTVLHIMGKEKVYPKNFEITLSGELSTDTVQAESVFKSFHVVYNIECDDMADQIKMSRAVNLAHEKHCGLLRMFRAIAPVDHEIAIVSTEPARA
ncbi:MAG: OsmC family protein [Alistipes sp.]